MSNFKSGNLAKPLITLGLAYFLFKVGSRPFEVVLGLGEEGGMRFRFFYYFFVLMLGCFWPTFIDRQGNNKTKDAKDDKEKEEKKKEEERKESDQRTTQGAGQDVESEGYHPEGD